MRPNRPHQVTWNRRQLWIAAVVAALATLAVLATNVTMTASTAQAVSGDGDSPFVSYNMHGSDNGTRWNSEVRPLARNNPLVALQEVGNGPPPPASSDPGDSEQIDLDPRPHGLPGSVQHVNWRVGRGGTTRHVYFLQTDPHRIGHAQQDTWDGGQMNLAMVTDTPADEVRVLENPTYDPAPHAPNNRYRSRPLLGLRFGDTWYWDTHARGEDVGGLLDQVRDHAARDGRNWALIGDFNRNILNRTDEEAHNRTLHLRGDEELVRSGQPTFINGDGPSELDYAVTHGLPGFNATRPRGAGSDHAPVHFARTPPPAREPTPAHAFPSTLQTSTGQMLQENPDGSFAVGDARYDNNQTWRMDTTDALTHSLRNVGTRHCIAIGSDARRDESSKIVSAACDDPRAQWTTSHLEDDPPPNEDGGGPQRWQNVAFPGLCLTPTDKSVTAEPCTKDTAQRWWDNSTSVSKGWRTARGNVRLESAFLGGRLRRANYTAPKPPAWQWLYWAVAEQADFGWNIQRISPEDNLVRLQSMDGTNRCLGSRDEHATTESGADLYGCDDARGTAGAGQRWLAESYRDGSIRFRNEANHLCLTAPDADHGTVSLYKCGSVPIERWNVQKP